MSDLDPMTRAALLKPDALLMLLQTARGSGGNRLPICLRKLAAGELSDELDRVDDLLRKARVIADHNSKLIRDTRDADMKVNDALREIVGRWP